MIQMIQLAALVGGLFTVIYIGSRLLKTLINKEDETYIDKCHCEHPCNTYCHNQQLEELEQENNLKTYK